MPSHYLPANTLQKGDKLPWMKRNSHDARQWEVFSTEPKGEGWAVRIYETTTNHLQDLFYGSPQDCLLVERD